MVETLLATLWLKSVKFGFVFCERTWFESRSDHHIFIYTFHLVLYQFILFCLLILNADNLIMVTGKIRLRLDAFFYRKSINSGKV